MHQEIMKFLSIAFMAFLLLLLLLQVHGFTASRFLHEGSKLVNKGRLELQSLQKGPVPPSQGSSCSNIPRNGGPACPLKGMHYAASALPRATAFPRLMAQFDVATDGK
ncbi:hypothetical protein DITRI_Ditri08aG0036300 [Diplodiscus trichospermus]